LKDVKQNWQTAKSHLKQYGLLQNPSQKRSGPKAPTAINGPLGPIFYPLDKANIVAACLEKQFRAHDLCDCNHRRHVEAEVEALLATVDVDIPVNCRPCDISKKIQSLKLGKACGFYGISNEYPRHLPKRSLVHLTHLINYSLRSGHLPAPWKEAEIINLPKLDKDRKVPQNLRPNSLLPATGKLFERHVRKDLFKSGLLSTNITLTLGQL
jgi:hypothetical protein